jgi:putative transposase
VKYAWIKQHKDSFSIAAMCRVMSVSKSGFYKWCSAVPSPRKERQERIRLSIRSVYEQSSCIYGSYKVARCMKADPSLESVCRNTVASAMREMGLKSRVVRKFRPTTTQVDPSRRPAPNLLDQSFEASRPNQKWVTDITYLPTTSGWVYLAVVLDLFSRKVIGWSLADNLSTPLVSDALRCAIEQRKCNTSDLLHHSDRGCQYTSDAYQTTLKTLGITCSMSRSGCCYDNAVMERFFWSLKHEWTKFESFADIAEARMSVFRYIETFYNSKRIHQTLEYKTPNQLEAEHELKLAV